VNVTSTAGPLKAVATELCYWNGSGRSMLRVCGMD